MKKNLLLFVLMLLPLAASADYNVVINGIYYLLNSTTEKAEVRGDLYGPNFYKGNVVIPETVTYEGTEYSVTSIGNGAFIGCSSLTSITIPNSVKSIGETAFADCGSLTSVYISNIAAWCSMEFKNMDSNPLYYAHQLYVNGVEVKDLVIPNSVTSISNFAFSGCSDLTSVTIPNSVTSIGNEAFYGCSGLTSVTIPNSVTSIGSFAFYRCSGLTSVTIPNSVKSIGSYAFQGCSGLTSITIPNSVTSIGISAFNGCIGLTSFSIPNSVTTIGSWAFYNCWGLTSVTIPNSVTSIGERAFADCRGLTSVTIGSGVRTVNMEAFAYCQELADVYCHAENVPSTSSDAFRDSYIENTTLHVPEASISAYKAAEPWKDFKNIVALDGSTPEIKKCATPTISYENGRLTFDCETEDVEFLYNVVPAPGVSGKGNDVEFKPMFTVSVYATKTGNENSEVATKEISIEGGSGLKGDVNGDGEVGIGDIISITNIMSIRP